MAQANQEAVHLYIRVSTDTQDERSQMQMMQDWLTSQSKTHASKTVDTVSGSVPWQKRKLNHVLELSRPGDSIVVSEISRIARSTIGVLSFLQTAAEKQINVYAVRNKLALDDSLHSKITVTVLALAAEIERDLIRERTKAALAARRAAGQKLGRPVGSTSPSILVGKEEEIKHCMQKRISKRAIARLLDCSPGTLYKFLKQSPAFTVADPEIQERLATPS